MKYSAARVVTLVLAAAASIAFSAAPSRADEIKVFSSTALKGVLGELVPQFEKQTGHKVALTIGPAAEMKTKIDGGAAFDIAVVTPKLLDDLVAEKKVDPQTKAVIAKSPLSLSTRSGGPTPPVATVDELKRALLNANSVGFNGNGASRAGAEAMFQKLGISEEIKSKIKLVKGSAPEAAARGEIQLGLSPQSEVIAAHGAQLVGVVPAQYGFYLTLVGAVSSASANADASRALTKFLTAPTAAPVLKAKGMEPG